VAVLIPKIMMRTRRWKLGEGYDAAEKIATRKRRQAIRSVAID
jgi:hypothetical protein